MSHTRSGHHKGDKLTVIFTIIMGEAPDLGGGGGGCQASISINHCSQFYKFLSHFGKWYVTCRTVEFKGQWPYTIVIRNISGAVWGPQYSPML